MLSEYYGSGQQAVLAPRLSYDVMERLTSQGQLVSDVSSSVKVPIYDGLNQSTLYRLVDPKGRWFKWAV
ncbi:MAG: hypothetical protein ACLT8H_07035 [Streptococcus parasanguinis]